MELKNICVRVSDETRRTLLDHVTVTLRRGELTLLLGCTGSGKTTLLQTMAGLKAPDSGDIRLEGEPIWRDGRVPQSVLLQIGLVFQFPEQQLFARDIKREMLYSIRPYRLNAAERERRIEATLAHWDPPRGDQGERRFQLERSPFALSGGEKRRLGLALGEVTNPDWMLLDEPSAGLEARSVRLLLDSLDKHRMAGGAAVIATHDLDTFLPHADRVLLLQEGRLIADVTPLELHTHPELLVQAGMGLPPSMRLAEQLRVAGMDFPYPAMTAEEMAEAIIRSGEEKASAAGFVMPEIEHVNDQLTSDRGFAAGSETKDGVKEMAVAAAPHAASSRIPHTVAEAQAYSVLDPRLKWVLYVLLVTAAMLQQNWLGLTLALIPVAGALAVLPRQMLMGCIKLMKPLVLFFVLSTALSGSTLTTGEGGMQLGFSLSQAEGTLLNLYRLFIVTLASLWFSLTTPYGRMVEGLNWVMAYGRRIKLPVASFALAVSLIFRFIPMIWSEWQRFSLIVRSRGKAAMKPNAVRIRDLGPMVIPLLMALFQRAEDMTIAMEMRKVRENNAFGARSSLLVWSRRDTRIGIMGLLVFAMLVSMRWL
ncbi:ATP-binding cassette domain-containing protein [Paenibacillus barcinonensis]|uniref:ATP-binding cassette domain-containing protein n=1 Tax=Paenibacillus barcinonensis TaxID=198119 RepID=A0A2V4VU20_PAEBA|nr:ATP-binding cassette domain-containing protein [Paenibacillus barcinonensis]PYE50290.1 energy-coupling factor transport system ATP-binding protein [Paenibacillus barcinonensis]QKS54973.1 ATP-binding cassette domain-containing protein [Paenibacillus barcinonensis]